MLYDNYYPLYVASWDRSEMFCSYTCYTCFTYFNICYILLNRNRHFWNLGLPYMLAVGIATGFGGMLGVLLTNHDISQVGVQWDFSWLLNEWYSHGTCMLLAWYLPCVTNKVNIVTKLKPLTLPSVLLSKKRNPSSQSNTNKRGNLLISAIHIARDPHCS